MGWTYASPNPFEHESFNELYSTGVSSDKISTLQILRIREVNEKLCIGEVGVDLEPCVHAHGHDVHLLIEVSFKINYSLGISSSYIWDLAFLQSLFRPCSPFKYHFSDKLKYLSSADHCTCPTFTLIYLRVLPPGISRISTHCTSSYEFLMKPYLSPVIITPRGLGCRQPRTLVSESNRPCDSVLLVFCGWEV